MGQPIANEVQRAAGAIEDTVLDRVRSQFMPSDESVCTESQGSG